MHSHLGGIDKKEPIFSNNLTYHMERMYCTSDITRILETDNLYAVIKQSLEMVDINAILFIEMDEFDSCSDAFCEDLPRYDIGMMF